jgi:hypothetical protein
VPAVSITSDAFDMSARAMASVQGFPGFEFYAVPHPVASLSRHEVRHRALEAIPELVRILGVES